MSVTYDQAIEAVLDFIMDEVRDKYERIECILDYIDGNPDYVPALNDLSDADYRKFQKLGSKKMEKMFKERFGFTAEQFVEQHQRVIRTAMTEAERKLVEEIERVCITNLLFNGEGKVGGTYYQQSPGNIFYFPDEYNGGIRFNDKLTQQYGMTLGEVLTFLDRAGAKKIKRPRAFKSPPSLYD
jgi:hypothetical protein